MPEFYCLTCDRTTTDDTCRDCGEETEELCPVCNEILDNCECEEPAK